ncbi:type VI secretion system-associated protein TagF [Aquabacterium sp.]|uniref:type VI secretion system-associated protein TagF n=1 Tax=Aquabacterium sp. TaxID=1872578 RepID=UPI002489B345|nr:type VI secretion system-associated protein TagF [Aquabacterium sp.]MDI1258125.1 type VI secretion system-associated protein TagF [Aquabacterium sp.]
MTATPPIPGWYGKLPTLGDFASRRLEPTFIDPWDAWLAEGIAGLRAQAEGTWLDHYLASPVWRFLLMPGVIGLDTAMAGVLMPSVDRVGRYFPLTLIAPIAPTPSTAADTDALLAWLHQLDDAAADALHDDWSIEQLESELERLLPPTPTTPAPSPGASALASVLQGPLQHAHLPVAGRADLSSLLAQSAATSWQAAAQGLAFWWTESAEGAPRSLVSRGLPRGDGFAALLGSAAA